MPKPALVFGFLLAISVLASAQASTNQVGAPSFATESRAGVARDSSRPKGWDIKSACAYKHSHAFTVTWHFISAPLQVRRRSAAQGRRVIISHPLRLTTSSRI